MDAKLELEVDVEGPAEMMERGGEERELEFFVASSMLAGYSVLSYGRLWSREERTKWFQNESIRSWTLVSFVRAFRVSLHVSIEMIWDQRPELWSSNDLKL
jgi:hypothetical protein